MIHPHTKIQFINEKIGVGVVATQFIPKGTIIWSLDDFDQIFTPQQVENMSESYKKVIDYFSFRNEKGNYVLCWDNTKFVNHNSNSNCLTTAHQYELAIRDIHPGEQLYNDYGYLNIEYDMEIEAEEGSGRTVIRPDDLLKYYPEWDEKLKDAYKYLAKVDQPLKDILKPHLWEDAIAISLGKKEMDSILLSYYDPN